MVGTTLKLRVDENADHKYNQAQVKKLTINTETTKRAALGELQNRGVVRNIPAKDAAQKDIKLKTVYGAVKSRNDDNVKKASLASNANNIAAASAAAPNNAAAKGLEGQRRIIIRSNSIRLGCTATNAAATAGANTLQRQGSSNNIVQTKIHATASTSSTLANAKVVEKNKVASKPKTHVLAEKNVVTGNAVTLRREDSNLSRKSLSKIRAQVAAVTKSKIVPNANTATAAAILVKKAGVIAPVKKTEPTKVVAKIVEPESAKVSSTKTNLVITHSSKRLEAIEDIDVDDAKNLVLVSMYVNDIYGYLYKLEAEQRIRPDHLSNQDEVTAKMRAVLIDWINEVHLQFHLAAETFHMAVAIIDLYLQAVQDTKRPHLQLVGVTALFIATKYEELFPPAIGDFVYITDDTYTAKQIRLMELKILKALDYNLSRPLPIHFLRRFSKAAGAEDVHHTMSKYFLELAQVEYELASYKPSEIAAASLFLTLHLINGNAKAATGFDNNHWTATLAHYSHYEADHLRPIAKIIANLARNAPQAKLKAVYTKYQSTKLHKIVTRTELYGPLMDSIIHNDD